MQKNKAVSKPKPKSKSKPNKNTKELSENTKVFIKTQILFLSLNALVFLTSVCVCLQMDFDRESIFYISIVSLAVGSFLASFYAGYKIHKNGLLVGLIFSLPINALVILISLMINNFEADYTAIVSFFILMSVAMFAGVLSVNMTMRAKR